MKRQPDLAGVPLAIVSEDGKVIVGSEDIEGVGVRAGIAVSAAKTLCPELRTLPYDRDVYMAEAEVIWNICAEDSSFVEPLSPEMCFLTLDGPDTAAIIGSLLLRLQESISCGVRIGVSRSRFLSEQAAQNVRLGQVLEVEPGHEREFGGTLPLAAAADPVTTAALQKLGLRTFADLWKIAPSQIPKKLRESVQKLWRLGAGQDGARIQAQWPPPAELYEIGFDDEVVDERILDLALSAGADQIAARLQRRQVYVRKIELYVVFANSTIQDMSEDLALPADDAALICRAARRLLGRIAVDRGVTGLHLRVQGLSTPGATQLSLFDPAGGSGLPHERAGRLTATLKHVRKRWGDEAIAVAVRVHARSRTNLWTRPVGKRRNVSVNVVADGHGMPTSYRRGCRYMPIMVVQDWWHETAWNGPIADHRMIYRALGESGELVELERRSNGWRMVGIAD